MRSASLWLDGVEPPDEEDASLELVRKKGFEHEATVLKALEADYGKAVGKTYLVGTANWKPIGERASSTCADPLGTACPPASTVLPRAGFRIGAISGDAR